MKIKVLRRWESQYIIFAVLKLFNLRGAMKTNVLKANVLPFVGNGVKKYRSLSGVFSYACTQRGIKLHEYLGNVDLYTLSIFYIICSAENDLPLADIKYALQTSSVRLHRSCKYLLNHKIIKFSIDAQDARVRLVTLDIKGKALKQDILDITDEYSTDK